MKIKKVIIELKEIISSLEALVLKLEQSMPSEMVEEEYKDACYERDSLKQQKEELLAELEKSKKDYEVLLSGSSENIAEHMQHECELEREIASLKAEIRHLKEMGVKPQNIPSKGIYRDSHLHRPDKLKKGFRIAEE